MFLTLLHYTFNTCATNPEFPQMVKQANTTPVFGKRKIYICKKLKEHLVTCLMPCL